MTTMQRTGAQPRLLDDRWWVPVATYLGCALGLALVVALLRPGAAGPAPLLTMATPTVAVLVAGRRAGASRSIWRAMGWRQAGLRWWPVAIVVPAAVVGAGYLVALMAGLAHRPPGAGSTGLVATLAPATVHLVLGLVIGTVLALGEEAGWRGFLVPELERRIDPGRAWLVAGLFHGLWHLPLLVLTDAYDPDGSRWAVAPSVVVAVTLAGPFYGWLRARSGTIWPVALAHGAVNLAFATAHRNLDADSPAALAYVAGESGAATIAVLALLTFVLLRPRRVTTPRPKSHYRRPSDGRP